jgi:hypothetical protein
LPTGIEQSLDFIQEIIEEVSCGLDACEVYIDDIGTFNNSWEEHLHSLDQVLKQLKDKPLSIFQVQTFIVDAFSCLPCTPPSTGK